MAQATMDREQMKMAEELLFTGDEKPSFAKKLYFGKFDHERVFPFPIMSAAEEERYQAFHRQLENFAGKWLDGDQFDRNEEIPLKVIKGLGDLGVLGMNIPPAFEGQGFSQYAYCKAMEVISAHCGSTALFVNAHQSIGLKAILLFGTDEQKKKWLPGLATGKYLAAFSLTEPNAGSDASGVETRAIFDAKKNVYRITGRKQWTTNGSMADVLTVMAQTQVDTEDGPKDKVSAFLVTPDMPGFKVVDKALEKVGMRGSKTANLAFENMEVPAENILGPKGGGLRVCLTVLDFGRTTFAATCTGAAKFALDRAIQHANERIQFKRPLSTFPLVKEKIARMSALVYAMDAATYLTAGLVDSGQHDFMLESAIIKVFNSDALWSILYETMQIFGGRSFFTDEPFERMMRDARLNMIGEGSNEVMRAFIGVVGLRDVGLELKGVLDAAKSPFSGMGELGRFAKELVGKLAGPSVPVKSSYLKKEAVLLSKATRRFGFCIPRLLAKYKEGVVEQQLPLNRLANSAMALYTAAAVISKLDGEINEVKREVGKLYLQMAFDTINENLDALFTNNDTQVESVADMVSKSRSKS